MNITFVTSAETDEIESKFDGRGNYTLGVQ